MKKVKIYISGAIAHHDIEERKAAFKAAFIYFKNAGYNPVNPFDNGLLDNEAYQAHMKTDLKMLLNCDMIYMLKGWESSNGAKLELNVATSCGIPVKFEL